VASEVARMLHLPLDVLVVRKIGHPRHREFAVGAMAEGNIIMLNEDSIGKNPQERFELDGIIAEEATRLNEYVRKFHHGHELKLVGKSVILVDDGLATGATMQAAIRSANRRKASRCIVAVPVASVDAAERLARLSDDMVVLVVDPDFDAVGRYYERFEQTTDDEVLALLHQRMSS
jgi:putative phosphoribosyl transferase